MICWCKHFGLQFTFSRNSFIMGPLCSYSWWMNSRYILWESKIFRRVDGIVLVSLAWSVTLIRHVGRVGPYLCKFGSHNSRMNATNMANSLVWVATWRKGLVTWLEIWPERLLTCNLLERYRLAYISDKKVFNEYGCNVLLFPVTCSTAVGAHPAYSRTSLGHSLSQWSTLRSPKPTGRPSWGLWYSELFLAASSTSTKAAWTCRHGFQYQVPLPILGRLRCQGCAPGLCGNRNIDHLAGKWWPLGNICHFFKWHSNNLWWSVQAEDILTDWESTSRNPAVPRHHESMPCGRNGRWKLRGVPRCSNGYFPPCMFDQRRRKSWNKLLQRGRGSGNQTLPSCSGPRWLCVCCWWHWRGSAAQPKAWLHVGGCITWQLPQLETVASLHCWTETLCCWQWVRWWKVVSWKSSCLWPLTRFLSAFSFTGETTCQTRTP